jgi:L-2-hydroxycarboxylate dehydrogenase (NAD+)
MKVEISKLEELMMSALRARRISEADAAFIVSDYLDAELEGRRTHGVGKFLLIDHALERKTGAPQVTSIHGAVAHVTGNADLGQIAARLAAHTAVNLARKYGVGLAALTNFSRFSRLGPYANLIASAGYVAIALNNAGPPAVAPYGSRDPILGTNPIAFAVPNAPEPTTIDFATSKEVWGQIRQSQLEGSALPAEAFLDENGHETRVPEKVNAVLPFGGPKGSALCLAVELLAGTLAGAAMGLKVEDEADLGAIFLAIHPASGDPAKVITPIQELLEEIRTSSPRDLARPVRVPGDRAVAAKARHLASGAIDIDDTTLQTIERMAAGGRGLEANNLNN